MTDTTIDNNQISKFCRSHSRLREVVQEVLLFDQVHSTNRVALKMGADGHPGGLALLAEKQTGGKGREARPWFSPAERNIHLSLLLRPSLPMRDYPIFSPAAAGGVVKGIEKMTGLEVGIKWPNDIMTPPGKLGSRKLGGILLESKTTGDQTVPLVIGIGLNVNLNREDFPTELQSSATSLKIETGKVLDRTALLCTILEEIAEQVLNLQEGNSEAVLKAVRFKCFTLGKAVRVTTAKQVFEGRAETIDEDGALMVRMGDGLIRRIFIGEITHLRECDSFS